MRPLAAAPHIGRGWFRETRHEEEDDMVENRENSRRTAMSRRRLLALLTTGGPALALHSAASAQTPTRGARREASLSDPGPADPRSLGTRLTQQFGVRYPFVGAGMAFVGLPPLVAAVSNAGGIGMLGASPEPPPVLQARIQAIKAATPSAFGVNFIIDTGGFGPFTTRDHIDVCIAEGVRLVTFHWNIPERGWVS